MARSRVQAAGKSTVADLLARQFERGVHVRGGQFRKWAVSGWTNPWDEDPDEARRLRGGKVNIAADARNHAKDGKLFDNIPPHNSYAFSANPALIYYCENETVDGVQFSNDPSSPASFPFHLLPKDAQLPLVGDHSSSFMSRPIPHLADHAIIFAGAQKNIGPAGLTILIVRQDCIVAGG